MELELIYKLVLPFLCIYQNTWILAGVCSNNLDANNTLNRIILENQLTNKVQTIIFTMSFSQNEKNNLYIKFVIGKIDFEYKIFYFYNIGNEDDFKKSYKNLVNTNKNMTFSNTLELKLTNEELYEKAFISYEGKN